MLTPREYTVHCLVTELENLSGDELPAEARKKIEEAVDIVIAAGAEYDELPAPSSD